MRYKNDWELAKKRLTAFWNQEVIDRCCISVTSWKEPDHPVPMFEQIEDHDEFMYRLWFDPKYIVARERWAMEHCFYGGESFPRISLNLGAAGHAGFFKGADYHNTDTVWFNPSVDPDDLDSLEFDKNSFLYQKTLEMARVYAEESHGDYIISMPDDSGNADALAHLVGSENLLCLMMEESGEENSSVKRALAKIQNAYESVMRDVYDIVKDNNEGGSCIGWLSTWAPGFHAQMQCDLSVMISNELYKEYIRPELQAQSKLLDYPLYHFDGAEQIRHLDTLLEIPEIRAIQWQTISNKQFCTDYIPELKRIQAAGKSIIIPATPKEVEILMENLSSKGLFMITSVPTQEEAEDLLKKVAKWTHE